MRCLPPRPSAHETLTCAVPVPVLEVTVQVQFTAPLADAVWVCSKAATVDTRPDGSVTLMVQAAPAVVAAETPAVVPRTTGSTTLVIRTLSVPVVTGVDVATGCGVADAVVPVGAVDAPAESGMP